MSEQRRIEYLGFLDFNAMFEDDWVGHHRTYNSDSVRETLDDLDNNNNSTGDEYE
tara:strand:- start:130 stop:294 length:165 start_codon:yes stop_codon:yes gene_type:complete